MASSSSSPAAVDAPFITTCIQDAPNPLDLNSKEIIEDRIDLVTASIRRFGKNQQSIWDQPAHNLSGKRISMIMQPPACRVIPEVRRAEAIARGIRPLRDQEHILTYTGLAVTAGDLVSFCVFLILQNSNSSKKKKSASNVASVLESIKRPLANAILRMAQQQRLTEDELKLCPLLDFERLRSPDQESGWSLFEYALLSDCIGARVMVSLIERQLSEPLRNPSGERFKTLWERFHPDEVIGLRAAGTLPHDFSPIHIYVRVEGQDTAIVANGPQWRALFPEWTYLAEPDYTQMGPACAVYPALRSSSAHKDPAKRVAEASQIEASRASVLDALLLVEDANMGWSVQARRPIPKGTYLDIFAGRSYTHNDPQDRAALLGGEIDYAKSSSLLMSYDDGDTFSASINIHPRTRGGMGFRMGDGVPNVDTFPFGHLDMGMTIQDIEPGEYVLMLYGPNHSVRTGPSYVIANPGRVSQALDFAVDEGYEVGINFTSNTRQCELAAQKLEWRGHDQQAAAARERYLDLLWRVGVISFITDNVQSIVNLLFYTPSARRGVDFHQGLVDGIMMAANIAALTSQGPDAFKNDRLISGHPLRSLRSRELRAFIEWVNRHSAQDLFLDWFGTALEGHSDWVVATAMFLVIAQKDAAFWEEMRPEALQERLDGLLPIVEAHIDALSDGRRGQIVKCLLDRGEEVPMEEMFHQEHRRAAGAAPQS